MKKSIIFIIILVNSCIYAQQIPDLSSKYTKLAPSVFRIYTYLNESSDMPCGLGSGCVISADGTCITNYHVLEGKTKAIAVMASGEEFEIKNIIDYNEKADLIKFKIGNGGKKFPACPVSYARPKTGESTFAIGYPQGFVLEGESTLSTGIISGYRTTEDVSYIQTTTPITHGSSGGGLFNSLGQLCGITSGSFISSTEDLHANLNMAIPTSEIQKLKKNQNLSLNDFFDNISKTSFYTQAMINFENKEYESAIENFKKHLEIYPNDGFTWYRIAQCGYIIFKNQYTSSGLDWKSISTSNLNMTEDALLNAIALNKNNHYAYAQLALLYMYFDSAKCNTLLNTNGKKTLYEHREDISACINACISIAPNSKITKYTVAAYYMDANLGNNAQKAIELYSNIIDVLSMSNKNDDKALLVDAYIGRALTKFVCFKGTERLNGFEDYNKALEIDPKNMEALCDKFAYLAQEGFYDDACKTYNDIYSINPNATLGGMKLKDWEIFICKEPPTIEFFTKLTDAKYLVTYKGEKLGYVDISNTIVIPIKMTEASNYDNYEIYKQTKTGEMKHFWSVRTTAYNKVNLGKSNVTTKVSMSEELIKMLTKNY